MAHGQMREVVLVEVEDPDPRRRPRPLPGPDGANDPPPDGGRSRARGGAWRRSRRARVVACSLVVVLLLGASVAGVRARDRSARLAALPGVLARVDPSLRELWRVPQRGWGQFLEVGADVLQFGPDLDGGFAVLRIDAATGLQQWSVPLPEVEIGGAVDCVVVGDAVRASSAVVVCQLFIPSEDPAQGPSGRTRQLVLDATSGARVAERALGGAGVSAVALGRDLILTEVLPDARAQVWREDPVTGEVRWTFRSEGAVNPAGVEQSWLFPVVEHGVVVVRGPTTWALAGDGTVLDEWSGAEGLTFAPGAAGLDVTYLPDGRFAVGQARGVGGGDAPYGVVVAPGERHGFTIPGPVLVPVVDDGSAASVLFTAVASDSGFAATSLETGRLLWTADFDTFPGDCVLLDGRFIVVLGRQVVAFDARSGQELWSVGVPIGNNSRQLLTDGRVLVVPEFFRGTGFGLVALSPADGRELWHAPLPTGVNALRVVDGRLLASTDADLVGLG